MAATAGGGVAVGGKRKPPVVAVDDAAHAPANKRAAASAVEAMATAPAGAVAGAAASATHGDDATAAAAAAAAADSSSIGPDPDPSALDDVQGMAATILHGTLRVHSGFGVVHDVVDEHQSLETAWLALSERMALRLVCRAAAVDAWLMRRVASVVGATSSSSSAAERAALSAALNAPATAPRGRWLDVHCDTHDLVDGRCADRIAHEPRGGSSMTVDEQRRTRERWFAATLRAISARWTATTTATAATTTTTRSSSSTSTGPWSFAAFAAAAAADHGGPHHDGAAEHRDRGGGGGGGGDDEDDVGGEFATPPNFAAACYGALCAAPPSVVHAGRDVWTWVLRALLCVRFVPGRNTTTSAGGTGDADDAKTKLISAGAAGDGGGGGAGGSGAGGGCVGHVMTLHSAYSGLRTRAVRDDEPPFFTACRQSRDIAHALLDLHWVYGLQPAAASYVWRPNGPAASGITALRCCLSADDESPLTAEAVALAARLMRVSDTDALMEPVDAPDERAPVGLPLLHRAVREACTGWYGMCSDARAQWVRVVQELCHPDVTRDDGSGYCLWQLYEYYRWHDDPHDTRRHHILYTAHDVAHQPPPELVPDPDAGEVDGVAYNDASRRDTQYDAVRAVRAALDAAVARVTRYQHDCTALVTALLCDSTRLNAQLPHGLKAVAAVATASAPAGGGGGGAAAGAAIAAAAVDPAAAVAVRQRQQQHQQYGGGRVSAAPFPPPVAAVIVRYALHPLDKEY